MAAWKKSIYSLLTFLILMSIFNLSPLKIPSDRSRYEKSIAYFAETEKQFGLPAYEQNQYGMGMVSTNNEIELLTDVKPALDEIIAEIQKSRNNINVAIHIIHDDQTGRMFKNILIEKARQGVEVRLLYDAWGSALTPMSYFNDLRKNGVKVTCFNPLVSGFLLGRLDNRLHRKMVIVDGESAFIGGLNIGDEYLSEKKGTGFWKDTGIIFRGDAALSIQQVFFNDWLQYSGESTSDRTFYPRVNDWSDKSVQIILGGPDSPLTEMGPSYVHLINAAQQNVWIVSPYFTPDKGTLNALYQAADRNVDVHIIVPRRNDSMIARITNDYYLHMLIRHGIRVSAYDHGFIHGKYMIVDNQMALVGTVNWDVLSFFRSYEITSLFNDEKTIQQLADDFNQNLVDSTPY